MPGSSAALGIQIWSGTEGFIIDCKNTRHRRILQARHWNTSGWWTRAVMLENHRVTESPLSWKQRFTEKDLPFKHLPRKKTIPVPPGEEQQGNHHESDQSPPRQEMSPGLHMQAGGTQPPEPFWVRKGSITSGIWYKTWEHTISMSKDNSKEVRLILSASSLKFR